MTSIFAVSTASIAKRMALAAACGSVVLGAALFAHHALAQTARSAAPKLIPGQSAEIIGGAAAVTSTVHYQAQLAVACGGSICAGNFPRPGAKRQLNITRISCYVESSLASTFRFGEIQLVSGAGAFMLRQLLPLDFSYTGSSGTNGMHTLNRAVDLQLGGGQHIRVYLELATGNASSSSCTATGTLSTLG